MADYNGPQKNWYSILGANPADDIQEIKQKYQKLILMFHPDKQKPGLSEEEAEQLLQKFIDVDQAWKILSDEQTRKEYNLQLRARELKQNWPVDAHVTLDDMNWDTDTECYTYRCRCGGEFILDREDIQETETVVCCDSCSLSIEVQKILHQTRKTFLNRLKHMYLTASASLSELGHSRTSVSQKALRLFPQS